MIRRALVALVLCVCASASSWGASQTVVGSFVAPLSRSLGGTGATDSAGIANVVGTTETITATGTQPIGANTTIWNPGSCVDTTFNLPANPVDNEPHSIANLGACPTNSLTVAGNGHNIGFATAIVSTTAGIVSVRYSSAVGAWELGGTPGTVSASLNFTPLNLSLNLSDVANVATARTNLGLGTIATQNASAVAITGGTIAVTSVGTTALNMSTIGAESISFAPIGNSPTTIGSFVVSTTGVSGNANAREFVSAVGLTSAFGNGGTSGNHKVAFYAGGEFLAGSANGWVVNTVAEAQPGFFVQGGHNHVLHNFEVDTNNKDQDVLTSTTNPAGLTIPYSAGMDISGDVADSITTFRNTFGVGVNGGSWQYGMLVLGDTTQAAFYTNTGAQFGLDIEGVPTTGVGITLAGHTPIAGMIDARANATGHFVLRGAQNLGSGAAISMLNDANNAFQGLEVQATELLITQGPLVVGAGAINVTAGQVAYGSTVTANTNCGSVGTGCIVINVAGTTRYMPYY